MPMTRSVVSPATSLPCRKMGSPPRGSPVVSASQQSQARIWRVKRTRKKTRERKKTTRTTKMKRRRKRIRRIALTCSPSLLERCPGQPEDFCYVIEKKNNFADASRGGGLVHGA